MKPKAARELAAKVLAQITEHPETHDQEEWWSEGRGWAVTDTKIRTCHSVGCVAGWAVALYYEGKRLPNQKDRISDRAQVLLGLTERERWWLFSEERTVDQVTAALQRIIDGEPVLP